MQGATQVVWLPWLLAPGPTGSAVSVSSPPSPGPSDLVCVHCRYSCSFPLWPAQPLQPSHAAKGSRAGLLCHLLPTHCCMSPVCQPHSRVWGQHQVPGERD